MVNYCTIKRVKKVKVRWKYWQNPSMVMYSYHPWRLLANYLRIIKKLYSTAAKAPNTMTERGRGWRVIATSCHRLLYFACLTQCRSSCSVECPNDEIPWARSNTVCYRTGESGGGIKARCWFASHHLHNGRQHNDKQHSDKAGKYITWRCRKGRLNTLFK